MKVMHFTALGLETGSLKGSVLLNVHRRYYYKLVVTFYQKG